MADDPPGNRPANEPASEAWMPRVWRTPEGGVVACVEKLKVMSQNLVELRQTAQDALEDAVLMGCSEDQVRDVLRQMVASLENPYRR